jgi:hypothetical protein
MEDWVWITAGVVFLVLSFEAIRKGRKAKNTSREMAQNIPHHFRNIGIELKTLSGQDAESRLGKNAQVRVALFELQRREVEFLEVVHVATGQGDNTGSPRFDYIFHVSGANKQKMVDTEVKSESLKWKNHVIGNNSLAESLNQNDQLGSLLIPLRSRMGIWDLEIIADPSKMLAKIRTREFLPTLEQLEAIDVIARHVKTVW